MATGEQGLTWPEAVADIQSEDSTMQMTASRVAITLVVVRPVSAAPR